MMSSPLSSSNLIVAAAFVPETIPTFKEHEQTGIVEQVACYFRQLLEGKPECSSSPAGWVQLPTLCELAKHFQCSDLDVLDALDLLQKQSYCCYMKNLETSIFLKDPLQRKPRYLTSRQKFSERLLKPLEALFFSSRSRLPVKKSSPKSNQQDRAYDPHYTGKPTPI